MKIIFLSDMHLIDRLPEGRTDDIQSVQWSKLSFILNYAKKNNCVILQAGDFSDKPRQWNLLSRLIKLLKKYDVEIYAVKGQHDQYYRSKDDQDNIFDILATIPLIHDISGKQINIGKGIYVTGVGWEDEIPKGNADANLNILVIHAPISYDEEVFESKRAKIFMREHLTYNIILCGDIHKHFMLRERKRAMLNTGPMLRLTADKYNFKHEPCFYVYDTVKRDFEKVIIPHKPAKEVLTRLHIEKKQEAELMLDNFISNLKQTKAFNAGVDIIKNINKYCKEKKVPKRIKRRIGKIMEK